MKLTACVAVMPRRLRVKVEPINEGAETNLVVQISPENIARRDGVHHRINSCMFTMPNDRALYSLYLTVLAHFAVVQPDRHHHHSDDKLS